MIDLIRAIAARDRDVVARMLEASPALATSTVTAGATRQEAAPYYLDQIGHYVYAGDTALHIAAAAYDTSLVPTLLAMGADTGARNRRGAEPLHYAADGAPGSGSWNPQAQATVIAALIAAGADPNATDSSGVAPLHRAVRTRCSAAVRALLDGGADARQPNRSGSTHSISPPDPPVAAGADPPRPRPSKPRSWRSWSSTARGPSCDEFRSPAQSDLHGQHPGELLLDR